VPAGVPGDWLGESFLLPAPLRRIIRQGERGQIAVPGLALGSEALALADRIAHPFSLAIALQYNSMLHLDRGEPEELAMQRLDAAVALAAEQRLGFVLEPQLLRGAALTARGALEEAIACVREGLEGPNGSTRLRSYGLAKLADTLTRRGEQSAALAAAREGLSTVEKTGHRQWKAELLRLEGVALFGLNMLEDSQNALERALRVARKQHAKANELRACHKPGAAVGRTGPASGSPRFARHHLWLVHRGVRHGGSERGKDAARRTGVSRSASMTKSLTRMTDS
jgi:tetratricopeptide (TPR) repeat protein